MKLTRLSLLLLVLVVSLMTSPEVFGARGKGSSALHARGGHHHTRVPNAKMMCDWFDIYCNNGSTDSCCGSVGSCLGYCEEVCGGPCIYVD